MLANLREDVQKYWAYLRGRGPFLERVFPGPLRDRIFRRDHVKLLRSLPMFRPSARRSTKDLVELTLDAANRTVPIIAEIGSLAGQPVADIVDIADFVNSDAKRTAAKELKALFDAAGSDKATMHDYHLLYGAILCQAEDIELLLEVGIGTNNSRILSNMGPSGRPGASLRAFRDFLPEAQIFGADVDTEILFEDQRIRTFYVDQTRPSTFEQLAQELPCDFDLIIDDGLHMPHANLATLLFALKKMKLGGWFVVEDIASTTLPIWQLVSALLRDKHQSYLVAAKGGLVFAIHRSC